MSQHDGEPRNVAELLEAARQGDEQALGVLLDWSRKFLRGEARDTLSPRLRVRVDESDLVQKACLAAFQQFGLFRGTSEGEYRQWLRRILQRDILELVERERDAAKRAVDREVSGSEPLRQAAGRQTSPSRRAIRNEERQIILQAIEQLPNDQQEAVRLRHLEHLSLREIAERIGKSEDAVMSLLRRGIFKLNEILTRHGLIEAEREDKP